MGTDICSRVWTVGLCEICAKSWKMSMQFPLWRVFTNLSGSTFGLTWVSYTQQHVQPSLQVWKFLNYRAAAGNKYNKARWLIVIQPDKDFQLIKWCMFWSQAGFVTPFVIELFQMIDSRFFCIFFQKNVAKFNVSLHLHNISYIPPLHHLHYLYQFHLHHIIHHLHFPHLYYIVYITYIMYINFIYITSYIIYISYMYKQTFTSPTSSTSISSTSHISSTSFTSSTPSTPSTLYTINSYTSHISCTSFTSIQSISSPSQTIYIHITNTIYRYMNRAHRHAKMNPENIKEPRNISFWIANITFGTSTGWF
jgi:hypothetical protein